MPIPSLEINPTFLSHIFSESALSSIDVDVFPLVPVTPIRQGNRLIFNKSYLNNSLYVLKISFDTKNGTGLSSVFREKINGVINPLAPFSIASFILEKFFDIFLK